MAMIQTVHSTKGKMRKEEELRGYNSSRGHFDVALIQGIPGLRYVPKEENQV